MDYSEVWWPRCIYEAHWGNHHLWRWIRPNNHPWNPLKEIPEVWYCLFGILFGYLQWEFHISWYQWGMGIWWYFCSQYHLGLYTKQEPSYLGKIFPVLIWSRMVLTQIITRVYKDSFTLRCHLIDINILTGMSILMPMGRFFDVVICVYYWYHDFIHLYNGPTLVWTSVQFVLQ